MSSGTVYEVAIRSSRALFLAYFSLLLLGLSDNVRGPLFPEIIQHFVLTDQQSSWFFIWSSAAGTTLGFLTFAFVKKWGRIGTLRLSFLGLALGQFVMARSVSYFELLLGSALFGGSLGIMAVLQNVLVVVGTPIETRPRWMAGLHAVYGGASLLAPLLVTLVATTFPENIWRSTFLVTGAVSLLSLVVSFFGKASLEGEVPHDSSQEVHGRNREIVYFAFGLACYVMGEIMLSSRLALFLRREYGFSLEQSSLMTTAFFVALFIGRLWMTFFPLKVSVHKQVVTFLILTLSSMVIGLTLHPYGLVIAGLFMAPLFPLLMLAVGQLFPHQLDRAVSTCIAIDSTLVVLMHWGVGVLGDQYGVRSALWLGPIFCAISLVLFLMWKKVFGERSFRGFSK